MEIEYKEIIDMPEFSVVMPAYNAEQYIEYAIESVIRQTFEDWELVVVNDASTDNTSEIVKQFVQKDYRIKYYSLPKQSGSAFTPRKEAVLKSTGKWIVTLDADDYLEDCYLEKIYNRAKETQADMILGRMYVPANGTIKTTVPQLDFDMEQIIGGEDACMLTIPTWRIGLNGATTTTTWISALNQINISAAAMNADEVLSRQLLLLSSKVAFVDAKYMYRYNENSITKKISLKSFDILYTNKCLLSLLKKHFGKDSKNVVIMQLQIFRGILNCAFLFCERYPFISKPDRKVVLEKIKNEYRQIDWNVVKVQVPFHVYFVTHGGWQLMMSSIWVYVFAKRVKQLFKHS